MARAGDTGGGSPFDTETMAELHATQGRVGEALAIYRRLAASAPDEATRDRRERRLAELTARPGASAAPAPAPAPRAAPERAAPTPAPEPSPPLPAPPVPAAPGVAIARRSDEIAVAWALADGTSGGALQLLLAVLGDGGIETQTRTLPLVTPTGSLSMTVPALRGAAAAVGSLAGGAFTPVARARA